MPAPTQADLQRAFTGKTVLVTGHTGFKGSWLVAWLNALGARVVGFSLPLVRPQDLFEAAAIRQLCEHVEGDVRDAEALSSTIRSWRPTIVFHLAAQPLVRRSYAEPRLTVETNVMGTFNLLEAIRQEGYPSSVVIVTSDKCYEPSNAEQGHREIDPLGGHDVYSMSKAAVELLVRSYRLSFFPPRALATHGVALASARAGNVIGGGDWSDDRIVPDAMRALPRGDVLLLRNPASVRPWQHVLEPLGGYLTLAAKLGGKAEESEAYCDAWNFGPVAADAVSVGELVQLIIDAYGKGSWSPSAVDAFKTETVALRLNIDKTRERLGWAPRWRIREAITRTVEWYRRQLDGESAAELQALCRSQISQYMGTPL